jgi:hypothetical protein
MLGCCLYMPSIEQWFEVVALNSLLAAASGAAHITLGLVQCDALPSRFATAASVVVRGAFVRQICLRGGSRVADQLLLLHASRPKQRLSWLHMTALWRQLQKLSMDIWPDVLPTEGFMLNGLCLRFCVVDSRRCCERAVFDTVLQEVANAE